MLQSQIHKRINFNFDKQKLIFDTSHELFSFAKVDEGTKELLNSLRKNPSLKYKKILDLGCGYGVIGIYLKKKFSSADVLCTDRDSLAIDFTKHNAKLNNTKIEAKASLDFEKISDKFSFIITNFPAKLEKEGLNYFISKSSEFLEKDGTLAVVIVKELENAMQEILSNEKIIVSFKEKNKSYSIYHLKFSEKVESDEYSYLNNKIEFKLDKNNYILKTSDALQEYNTPHFITQLIMNSIINQRLNKYKTITVINPGQGFVPISIVHPCSREKIILASQDLLQLKISSENLKLNAVDYFETINSDFPQTKGDLLIWSLRDEDHKEILEKLEIYRRNFKEILLGGRLPVLKRVMKECGIAAKKEFLQRNGYGVIFINSLN